MTSRVQARPMHGSSSCTQEGPQDRSRTTSTRTDAGKTGSGSTFTPNKWVRSVVGTRWGLSQGATSSTKSTKASPSSSIDSNPVSSARHSANTRLSGVFTEKDLRSVQSKPVLRRWTVFMTDQESMNLEQGLKQSALELLETSPDIQDDLSASCSPDQGVKKDPGLIGSERSTTSSDVVLGGFPCVLDQPVSRIPPGLIRDGGKQADTRTWSSGQVRSSSTASTPLMFDTRSPHESNGITSALTLEARVIPIQDSGPTPDASTVSFLSLAGRGLASPIPNAESQLQSAGTSASTTQSNSLDLTKISPVPALVMPDFSGTPTVSSVSSKGQVSDSRSSRRLFLLSDLGKSDVKKDSVNGGGLPTLIEQGAEFPPANPDRSSRASVSSPSIASSKVPISQVPDVSTVSEDPLQLKIVSGISSLPLDSLRSTEAIRPMIARRWTEELMRDTSHLDIIQANCSTAENLKCDGPQEQRQFSKVSGRKSSLTHQPRRSDTEVAGSSSNQLVDRKLDQKEEKGMSALLSIPASIRNYLWTRFSSSSTDQVSPIQQQQQQQLSEPLDQAPFTSRTVTSLSIPGVPSSRIAKSSATNSSIGSPAQTLDLSSDVHIEVAPSRFRRSTDYVTGKPRSFDSSVATGDPPGSSQGPMDMSLPYQSSVGAALVPAHTATAQEPPTDPYIQVNPDVDSSRLDEQGVQLTVEDPGSQVNRFSEADSHTLLHQAPLATTPISGAQNSNLSMKETSQSNSNKEMVAWAPVAVQKRLTKHHSSPISAAWFQQLRSQSDRLVASSLLCSSESVPKVCSTDRVAYIDAMDPPAISCTGLLPDRFTWDLEGESKRTVTEPGTPAVQPNGDAQYRANLEAEAHQDNCVAPLVLVLPIPGELETKLGHLDHPLEIGSPRSDIFQTNATAHITEESLSSFSASDNKGGNLGVWTRVWTNSEASPHAKLSASVRPKSMFDSASSGSAKEVFDMDLHGCSTPRSDSDSSVFPDADVTFNTPNTPTISEQTITPRIPSGVASAEHVPRTGSVSSRRRDKSGRSLKRYMTITEGIAPGIISKLALNAETTSQPPPDVLGSLKALDSALSSLSVEKRQSYVVSDDDLSCLAAVSPAVHKEILGSYDKNEDPECGTVSVSNLKERFQKAAGKVMVNAQTGGKRVPSSVSSPQSPDLSTSSSEEPLSQGSVSRLKSAFIQIIQEEVENKRHGSGSRLAQPKSLSSLLAGELGENTPPSNLRAPHVEVHESKALSIDQDPKPAEQLGGSSNCEVPLLLLPSAVPADLFGQPVHHESLPSLAKSRVHLRPQRTQRGSLMGRRPVAVVSPNHGDRPLSFNSISSSENDFLDQGTGEEATVIVCTESPRSVNSEVSTVRTPRRLESSTCSQLGEVAISALRSTEDFSRIKLKKTIPVDSHSKNSVDLENSVLPQHYLFMVKGRRRTQVRLVNFDHSSVTSNDSYVFISPREVICWYGNDSNVLEKSKASEVASRIKQKNEMGCKAPDVVVIDEAKQDSTRFWSVFGQTRSQTSAASTALELSDADYEQFAIASNMVYNAMVVPDGTGTLHPILEFCNRVPSRQVLKTEAILVFDFGSEVYTWIGKGTTYGHRKGAIAAAKKLYEQKQTPAEEDSVVSRNASWSRSRSPSIVDPMRPRWALFVVLYEGSEWVVFREKFSDWPSSSRIIRMKGGPAVVGELSSVPAESAIELVNPMSLLGPPPPLKPVVLDCIDVGRGTGKPVGIEGYHVVTTEVRMWHVFENRSCELPPSSLGQLHSGEGYVLRWQYNVISKRLSRSSNVTDLRNLGKQKFAYFFWLGNDCTVTEKGAAAVMTVELDTEHGPQVRVVQGKEPPCFLRLFDGGMVVHAGKRGYVDGQPVFTDRTPVRLYCVRGEHAAEASMLQVPPKATSLRSRSSSVLLLCRHGEVLLWHGSRSAEYTREAAMQAARKLIERHPEEALIKDHREIGLTVIEEGQEPEIFWLALNNERSLGNISPGIGSSRLFRLSNISGKMEAQDVFYPALDGARPCPYPFLQDDLYTTSQPAIFLFDTGHDLFLWFGWDPDADDSESTGSARRKWDLDKRAAMQSTLQFAKEAGRHLLQTYIVHAGCEPDAFCFLFPYWVVQEHIRDTQIEEGRKVGEMTLIQTELQDLSRDTYTYAELCLRPLPQGVDPLRLETYLSDEEFVAVFKTTREDFLAMPKWKSTILKKSVNLY